MGVRICNSCSKKNWNDEIIFSNRGKNGSLSSTFYESLKLYTNNNLTESDYNRIKNSIELSIKERGEIINNSNISEILSIKNPIANNIKIPDEILHDKTIRNSQSNLILIQENMVKFSNGEIYEGGWNIKAQRHGYGVSINEENNVYKGLWENDNFGSYGAFIEKNGNYYLGQLENG